MWQLELKKYSLVLIATLTYANSSLYDLRIIKQFRNNCLEYSNSLNVIDNQLWECGSCVFMIV